MPTFEINATSTIVIPQVTKGLVISVSSGGYVMTGYTATLLLQPQVSQGVGPTVLLPLVVSGDGLSGTYTTTGTEFTTAGFYNAQLKITNGPILLYSVAFSRQFSIQAVLG